MAVINFASVSKIFFVDPVGGKDPDLVFYVFEPARRHFRNTYPDAIILIATEDSTIKPLRKMALTSSFNPDVTIDRKLLLLSEPLESTELYLLLDWQEDEFCLRVRFTTEAIGTKIHCFPETVCA